MTDHVGTDSAANAVPVDGLSGGRSDGRGQLGPAEAAIEDLARLLSRERLLLELLLFKLVTLRQLLAGGESRFLNWASDELERAIDKVRKAELARAMAVSELAAATGRTEAQCSLNALAESAAEPWRSIFSDHKQGFGRLSAEITDALAATRRLATAGSAAVTAMLERLTGPVPESQFAGANTYGPGAQWDVTTPAPRWSQAL